MESSERTESFTSRWGMLISILGIAVGTGNIWRFPRIAAENCGEGGGGGFLIAWAVFLLLWSIPLIIAELAIGRRTRLGVAGSFGKLLSRRFVWMGAFVGIVATAIMFYYSVVNGWCLFYLVKMSFHGLPADREAAGLIWDDFQAGGFPVLFHFLVMFGGALVVVRGIRAIERVNRVLVPALLLIVLISAVRALTLPGALEGVKFLFTPDFSILADPKVWLEALTQNAWDTGAGWGLILTYAVYMQRKQGVTLNACLTGFGNNSVSLLAAMTIFATVFATVGGGTGQAAAEGAAIPSSAAAEAAGQPEPLRDGDDPVTVLKTAGPGSTGLTFIWMPQLFREMPLGRMFAILFFLGLSFAAFSSLLSMVELASRSLVDMGMKRWKAVVLVCGVGYSLGVPSALSLDYFCNQDFVWSVALMVSGAFIAFLCIRYGATRFRRDVINLEVRDVTLGGWWDLVIRFVIPLESLILFCWWMYRSAADFARESWYDPLSTYSVATCVCQWGVVVGMLIFCNRFMARKIFGKPGHG